ncbi:uncharacterized protein BO97DRAFT_70054 [Aspergillus homomorphus CBS 101889]|uniref:AT hook motif protein n=1 Tax=Aspergillus homomorphus (strain CBS 101889) TaxID=1450537 RepID=A0A395HW95_ASPHC|nr:hypothetical protein BO97DRAFT_70054 [Aspergillus homomorphus CBS 101889]RAL12067.1 hypothetical protein BO97DRAFT_70054 [Aspergillus homomorphus CBS 101889]
MPMAWNDTADAKLLLAVLRTTNVKLDHLRIAQYMGPGCTVYAIQHRLRVLKERAFTGPALPLRLVEGYGSCDPTSEGTPTSEPKRKRGRPRKVKEEDGVDAETPMDPKKEGRAKRVKTEEAEDGDQRVEVEEEYEEGVALPEAGYVGDTVFMTEA